MTAKNAKKNKCFFISTSQAKINFNFLVVRSFVRRHFLAVDLWLRWFLPIFACRGGPGSAARCGRGPRGTQKLIRIFFCSPEPFTKIFWKRKPRENPAKTSRKPCENPCNNLKECRAPTVAAKISIAPTVAAKISSAPTVATTNYHHLCTHQLLQSPSEWQ